MLKENKMEIKYRSFAIRIEKSKRIFGGNVILAKKFKYIYGGWYYDKRIGENDSYAIHKRIKRDDRA